MTQNTSIAEYPQHKRKRGRPRTTELYASQIRHAENLVADHLPQSVCNIIALADGVWVEEFDEDGKRHVYKEKPDLKANEYLIDRIMGKPTERREVTVDKPLEDMSEDELRAIRDS